MMGNDEENVFCVFVLTLYGDRKGLGNLLDYVRPHNKNERQREAT